MTTPGDPGGAQSLSSAQFGGVNMPTMPAAHTGMSGVEPRPPTEGAPPLASQASTFGSAKLAATWRKPGLLPLGRATLGSTFQPFGPQTAA